jgi:hypothetical protein
LQSVRLEPSSWQCEKSEFVSVDDDRSHITSRARVKRIGSGKVDVGEIVIGEIAPGQIGTRAARSAGAHPGLMRVEDRLDLRRKRGARNHHLRARELAGRQIHAGQHAVRHVGVGEIRARDANPGEIGVPQIAIR